MIKKLALIWCVKFSIEKGKVNQQILRKSMGVADEFSFSFIIEYFANLNAQFATSKTLVLMWRTLVFASIIKTPLISAAITKSFSACRPNSR